jgi:hypothetical protein
VPVAGVLCCWIARGQIQRSEGTLSGSALAGWGIGLTLVFGLNYLAYYASTTFAIRQQAREFTQEWLEKLKQRKLDEAFLMMVPQGQRPAEGEDLRSAIEVKFNRPNTPAGGSGAYTTFTQLDFVRVIAEGGERTEIVPGENVRWEHDQGLYKVYLDYQVRTEFGTLDLTVAAQGSEPADGVGGRQWQILKGPTGARWRESTRRGNELLAGMSSAAGFGMNWAYKLSRRDLDGAYLDTLPAGRREGQRRGWGKCELPVPALADPQARAFLQGRAAFRAGGAVRADAARFWAGKEFRQEIVGEVKKIFTPDPEGVPAGEGPPPPRAELTIQQVKLPWWGWEEGMFRVRLAAQVRIPHPPELKAPPGHPRFMVEGELVLETPAAPGEVPESPAWRVAALELQRGFTASAPTNLGRERPPGPGGAPAPGRPPLGGPPPGGPGP